MDAYINGISLHYVEEGDAHALPVVLIHGMTFDHRMWEPQVRVLKEKCRVIAYDLRGHGRSGVGDGQFTHRQLADDLVELLDHLGIQEAVLCGLSMGGAIALRVTELYPKRVRALVLCNTTCSPDSNESKCRREKAIQSIKKNGLVPFADDFLQKVFALQSLTIHRDVVDSMRETILSASPTGICGALLAQAARTDLSDSLPHINIPTLLIAGSEDTLTPPDLLESMHRRIHNSEFQVILGAAHVSNLENTPEFNRHMLHFVERLT